MIKSETIEQVIEICMNFGDDPDDPENDRRSILNRLFIIRNRKELKKEKTVICPNCEKECQPYSLGQCK